MHESNLKINYENGIRSSVAISKINQTMNKTNPDKYEYIQHDSLAFLVCWMEVVMHYGFAVVFVIFEPDANFYSCLKENMKKHKS